MEFLQSYTFPIKHKKELNNKVVDTLNRRLLIVQEVKLQCIGIEQFTYVYVEDTNFVEAHKVCNNFENNFHSKFSKFALHNGLLFKGKQLCVPRGSMRENLIQKKHNGSMSGHF